VRKLLFLPLCLALAGCASMSDPGALAKLSHVGVVAVTSNAAIGWVGEQQSSHGLFGNSLNLMSNAGNKPSSDTGGMLSRADDLIADAEAALLDSLLKAGGVTLEGRGHVLSSRAYAEVRESGTTGMLLLKPQHYKFVQATDERLARSLASELGLDGCVQASFQLEKTMKTGIGKTGVMGAEVILSATVADAAGKMVFTKGYTRISKTDVPVVAGLYDPRNLHEAFKAAMADACADFAADFSH